MRRTTILLIAAPALLATGCTANGTGTTTAASVTSPSAAPSTTASTATPTTPATTASGSGSGGGSGASTTSVPRCHTADLSLSFGKGGAASGTESAPLIFTNKSTHTCTLYGYPGVSSVAGDDGHQVGNPFKRGGTLPKVTITLKAGQQAHTNLDEETAQDFPKATCVPTQVRGLRVYPPDETASLYIAAPETVCAGKSLTIDTVEAISAGTTLNIS